MARGAGALVMEGRQEQPQAAGRKGGALGQVHANLDVTHVANVFRVLNVMVVGALWVLSM